MRENSVEQSSTNSSLESGSVNSSPGYEVNSEAMKLNPGQYQFKLYTKLNYILV